MKLCSLQIKAACQKVHIIKSHKPAHKRKVFYSFTSERYRIRVPHCWLQHTCWDTLEKTSFHLLGVFSASETLYSLALPSLIPNIEHRHPSPWKQCCFWIFLLCWHSRACQDSEPKQAACLLGNLPLSFLYTLHCKRKVACETLHQSIIHNWLPQALLFSLHWKDCIRQLLGDQLS